MFWVNKQKALRNEEVNCMQNERAYQVLSAGDHEISMVDESSDDNDWGESTAYTVCRNQFLL